jgi:hypothetical protein
MRKKNKKALLIIGRRELVSFPSLQLLNLEAKIDTGAYTSALHCKDIYLKNINGKNYLCFKLLDETHPEYIEKEFQFSEFDKKIIKSSFGEFEERYLIKTNIILAGRKIALLISLTDRTNMKYPVLIGRRLLNKKFIVDVNKKHTGGIAMN